MREKLQVLLGGGTMIYGKLVLFGIIAVLGCLNTQAGTYSGGIGDATDPYRIGNTADWFELIATPGDYENHFILTADLDFGGVEISPVAQDLSTNAGFQGTLFNGVMDGAGHVIRNAHIHRSGSGVTTHLGLFGYLGSSGIIRNLGIINISVIGLGVTDQQNIGVLVGKTGNNSRIIACYTSGSATGTGRNIGGLVGYSASYISECYSSVTTSGYSEVGGLVGWQYHIGRITACYAIGTVACTDPQTPWVGGLVGRVGGGQKIRSSFWNHETTGQMHSGGKGLSTEQMKSVSVFQNAGWSVYSNWMMTPGQYPRLAWENTGADPIPTPGAVPFAGSGTAEDPYLVVTPEEFALLSWHIQLHDKHILLNNDLDMSGMHFYPMGDLAPFSGVFNGNMKVIRNAHIFRPNSGDVGLFGYTTGKIYHLGVENVASHGVERVGGLIGWKSGSIVTACYATGTASGMLIVGGLVGDSWGELTNSYSITTVTSTDGYG